MKPNASAAEHSPGKPTASAPELSLPLESDKLRQLENRLLLQAIYEHSGYDFRDYASASLSRRIQFVLNKHGFESPSQLLHPLLRNPTFFEQVLNDLTVHVSDFFRHPKHFLALKEQVFAHLKTHPEIRIWHAGCARGEEVYSLAILLYENHLFSRSTIYATDISAQAIYLAQKGIFELEHLHKAAAAYQASGGEQALSDYYTAGSEHAILKKELREKIVFSVHNLVSDASFAEMHLILCQNVLIYFNRPLQDRVLDCFQDSLCPQGFLCLGPRESLAHTRHAQDFERFVPNTRLYRKLSHV